MTNNMNTVAMVGHLTHDAECRHTDSGYVITTFALAVNRSYKKDGEVKTEVYYFNCTIFGKFGEAVSSYLKKGTKVAVTGSLRQARKKDEQGNTKSWINIVVDRLELLSKKRNEEGNTGENFAYDDKPSEFFEFNDEDIPFD